MQLFLGRPFRAAVWPSGRLWHLSPSDALFGARCAAEEDIDGEVFNRPCMLAARAAGAVALLIFLAAATRALVAAVIGGAPGSLIFERDDDAPTPIRAEGGAVPVGI